MKPWCVFYGTRVALVFAPSKKKAYEAFIAKAFPVRAGGRYAPPTKTEVRIRLLRSEDAGWIEEFPASEAKPFHNALKRVSA